MTDEVWVPFGRKFKLDEERPDHIEASIADWGMPKGLDRPICVRSMRPVGLLDAIDGRGTGES